MQLGLRQPSFTFKRNSNGVTWDIYDDRQEVLICTITSMLDPHEIAGADSHR